MNTIATQQYRDKYRLAQLDHALRNALVAEKICMVDRTDLKYIYSPYQTAPTAVVQAIVGTYATAAYTTTNDTLTVSEEVYVAEHVYDFENSLSRFDVFAARIDDHIAAIAAKIDAYVLNEVCDVCTGSYSTPSGGFTTAANIPVILSNLCSKVMGYADAYKGLYLVIENTDIPGFMQYQPASGFSYADAALNNGFIANIMGVEVYVVRTGTFVSDTWGSKTWTNSGHRLFGVKNVFTYAAPRGIQVEEKSVSAKTGKEIVTLGYIGVGVWIPKRALGVDITIV